MDGESKEYFSETKCQIGFKKGCIFNFVHCPKIYLRNLINLDQRFQKTALEGPFGGTLMFRRVP